jgi:hypothetical protein
VQEGVCAAGQKEVGTAGFRQLCMGQELVRVCQATAQLKRCLAVKSCALQA